MARRGCDVAIVGGGVMGCAIARALAREGLDAVVLERAVPGAEASSAAAGILGAQLENESPGPGFELGVLSRMRWPAFAAELEDESGVPLGYRPSGALKVAFDEAEVEAFRARVRWQARARARAEWLDAPALRAHDAALSDAALGAAWFADDAQVEPRALARALAIAAERAGARFVTGQLVRGLVEARGRVTGVELADGPLHADAVVVAAGSWSALVPGGGLEALPVRPVRGQLVELAARAPLRPAVVFGGGGYIVPRADGRVVAGSTVEHVGHVKDVTAAGLARVLGVALRLVPALAEAGVLSHWAGLRPWTGDGLPVLGPGPRPGLHLATGHFRNGILLAPVTADIVSASLCGSALPVALDPFSWTRFAKGAARRGRARRA